jgi:hypothetical protein
MDRLPSHQANTTQPYISCGIYCRAAENFAFEGFSLEFPNKVMNGSRLWYSSGKRSFEENVDSDTEAARRRVNKIGKSSEIYVRPVIDVNCKYEPPSIFGDCLLITAINMQNIGKCK